MKNLLKMCSMVVLVLAVSGTAQADWVEQAKLLASDGSAGDYFGRGVSLSGDYAIVGAQLDGDKGTNSGSAYIFKRDGTSWLEVAKLTASDGAAHDGFGYSASISGNYAIVGSLYDDNENGTDCGSAYVFYFDGANWSEQAKLTASDGAAEDYFGRGVCISGDYAIIGAYGDDDKGTDSGSAYIFKRNGEIWVEQAKLTASDGVAGDMFGHGGVSISGGYAIVGAEYGDGNEVDSGSAYIFKRDGESWIEKAKLTASDGAAGDYFGHRVCLRGEYAIVGAGFDDDNGTDSGSAYIFKRDGESWTEQVKLIASDGVAGDRFGYTVSIDGDYAIVGAHRDDSEMGSASIFKRDGTSWIEVNKLTPSDAAVGDIFGISVAINGNYAIVGATYNDDNGYNSGSAYIFALEPVCWTEQVKILASDGAAGDLFGRCSISVEYAIVGAPRNDDNGTDSGSAHIFKRDGTEWTHHTKLVALDGSAGNGFGCSVCIKGDYAIVGAHEYWSGGAGSAYVFKCIGENWTEEAKLTASDGATYDEFGWSVSISGDYAIVGACKHDADGTDSGAAYIFKRGGESWIEQCKLTAADAAAGDLFGHPVSLDGNYAIIGTHGDDNYSGSAYIFKLNDVDPNTWDQQAKLTASDRASVDRFGGAVSISDNWAIIGAYDDDDNGASSGSAYVFEKPGSSWVDATETVKLKASDGAAYDWFGISVSISGNYAVVGAIGDDDNGTDSGSAYIFNRDGAIWTEQAKLTASDGVVGDSFGYPVSVDVDYVIVGAQYGDGNEVNSGSAYFFANVCNVAPLADAGDNQAVHAGTVVTLDGSGSSDPDEHYPLSYLWAITSKPEGSIAELSDANAVNPSFFADMVGDYIIQLVVTDSSGADSAPDELLVSTYNTPPVPDAGEDQAVIELGSVVQLDGSQSWDDDGDDIGYFWTITSKPGGSLAVLDDPCSPTPTFVADTHGDYVICLIVTDSLGAVSDPYCVTVSFENIKPVADAGGNQAVVVGDTVLLDGSGSYDGNGDPLTYSWSFVSVPEGSLAEIADPVAVQTNFVVDEPGAYVVSLVVNDGFVDSDSDNATIMAITFQDAAAMKLVETVETTNELPPETLKNENLSNALTN